ncbi:MAG: hypothetical protein ACP5LW_06485 [Nitrososphaeria archaeon]
MIPSTRFDATERASGRAILSEGRIFIAPEHRESLSDSIRRLRRPFVVALYTRKGLTMDRIVEGFHRIGLPLSTKTVSAWVGKERTRGFDVFHNRQTYRWKKFFGKLYRRWRLAGKITAPLLSLFHLFLEWVAYYRMTGIFDLDALMDGERPP